MWSHVIARSDIAHSPSYRRFLINKLMSNSKLIERHILMLVKDISTHLRFHLVSFNDKEWAQVVIFSPSQARFRGKRKINAPAQAKLFVKGEIFSSVQWPNVRYGRFDLQIVSIWPLCGLVKSLPCEGSIWWWLQIHHIYPLSHNEI